MRKTSMPDRRGCPGDPIFGKTSRGLFRFNLHNWEYSLRWNGQDKSVLPFREETSGISRSGWRCFHCGRFVWDQTDREYSLSVAESLGYLPQYRRLMQACQEVSPKTT